MRTIETSLEMKEWAQKAHREGKKIAFVPTMGALHEGHLSLIRIARKKGDCVVVSVFVNPLQFDTTQDLNCYPRMLHRDLKLLLPLNVEVVFVPTVAQVYTKGFQTHVNVSLLSKNLCGKHRPGHFEGVATVVLKLFNMVEPNVAIFGDKDYQQRRVIEQMTQDLNLGIEIIAAPIVRESDGLAMSSRNVQLSADERKRALILSQSLRMAKEFFFQGERSAKKIIEKVSEMIDRERPTKVDYVEICDAETLERVSEIQRPVILAVAVYFGSTRLIDNITLGLYDID